MEQFIVTIDGQAASGKSSISKRAAAILGFQHVDAGMLFRAMTLHLLRSGHDFKSDIPEELLNGPIDVSFKDGKVYLHGDDVTNEVQGPAITPHVIKLGSSETFKQRVYGMERALAKNRCTIFSGRDTGQVVFPNADVKFFVTASLEARAQRRLKDYQALGKEVGGLKDVMDAIASRDAYDLENGSLVEPENSIALDNSDDEFMDRVDMVVDVVKYAMDG